MNINIITEDKLYEYLKIWKEIDLNSDIFKDPEYGDIRAQMLLYVDYDDKKASILMYNQSEKTGMYLIKHKKFSLFINSNNMNSLFDEWIYNFTHYICKPCKRQYPKHWKEIGMDKHVENIERILKNILSKLKETEENKND